MKIFFKIITYKGYKPFDKNTKIQIDIYKVLTPNPYMFF